jgi:hypothetical protein
MESPDDPLVRLGVAESRRVCTSSGIGSLETSLATEELTAVNMCMLNNERVNVCVCAENVCGTNEARC